MAKQGSEVVSADTSVVGDTSTTGTGLSCDLDFYWTVASGCSRKSLREAQRTDNVEAYDQNLDLSSFDAPGHVMVSFQTLNNKPWIGPEWFIDSGGFSALTTGDEAFFDTPVTEYIEYLDEHIERGVSIGKWALRD